MLRSSPALGPRPAPASSWFRSVEGRRYGRHFLGLIALKIVLLTALYFVFIAQQPRADTSPDRVFDAIRGAPAAAPANPPDSQSRSESKP
jgi:hypothetical protein